jgi:4-amino-4-deoxy-L-arabinose transferase-like glycosyltransferase
LSTRVPAASNFKFSSALITITGVALVVHLAYFVLARHTPLFSDAQTYRSLGQSLADGKGYIRPHLHQNTGIALPSAEFPPLFPLLLAGFDLVGASTVSAQRLFITVLSLATVVLIGLLSRRVAGPTVGVMAAAFAAIYPMIWMSDAALMSESLYLFLVVAALLLLYRIIDEPGRMSTWAFFGGVGGLAALTRSQGIWLPLFLGVPAALFVGAGSWKRRVLHLVAVIGVSAAVIAPWTIRNADRFNTFVPLSTNFGLGLLGANCPASYYGVRTGSWVESCAGTGRTDGRLDQATLSVHDEHAALSYVGDHLGRLPTVVAARVLRLGALYHTGDEIAYEAHEGRVRWVLWLGTAMFWVLGLLAARGMWVSRRRHPIWPLTTSIGFVVFQAAVLFGNQRLRIDAEPAIIILAGIAIEEFLRNRTGLPTRIGLQPPTEPPSSVPEVQRRSGARSGTRTRTTFQSMVFETIASACSAIRAGVTHL